MLVACTQRPFSDVCSTVSCWALLLSALFPSMQVSLAQAHPHSHSQTPQRPVALTVYLDSASFQSLSGSFWTSLSSFDAISSSAPSTGSLSFSPLSEPISSATTSAPHSQGQGAVRVMRVTKDICPVKVHSSLIMTRADLWEVSQHHRRSHAQLRRHFGRISTHPTGQSLLSLGDRDNQDYQDGLVLKDTKAYCYPSLSLKGKDKNNSHNRNTEINSNPLIPQPLDSLDAVKETQSSALTAEDDKLGRDRVRSHAALSSSSSSSGSTSALDKGAVLVSPSESTQPRLLWQGLAFPSRPIQHELTGRLYHFPQRSSFSSSSLPSSSWVALVPCSADASNLVLTATRLRAGAVLLYPLDHPSSKDNVAIDGCSFVSESQQGQRNLLIPTLTLHPEIANNLISLIGQQGTILTARIISPVAVVDELSNHHSGAKRASSPARQENVKKEEAVATTMISTPFVPLSTSFLLKTDARPRTTGYDQSQQNHREEAGARVGSIATATVAEEQLPPQKKTGPASAAAVVMELLPKAAVVVVGGNGATHRASLKSNPWIQKYRSFSMAKFIQDTSALVKDDSMTGKLAMILMSTLCGVGVGMFGALLFVVALKIHMFQTGRSDGQQGHEQHISTAEQHQVHRQLSQHGYKKVIPQGILESFGVQTVMFTSTTIMTTSALPLSPEEEDDATETDAQPSSDAASAALLSKAKLAYAEDLIEIEGFGDLPSRENARRLRLMRTRSGHLLRRSAPVHGRDALNSTAPASGTGEEEGEWEDVLEGEGLESMENDEEEAATEMERITAAIMTATRRGSYRRASLSRQGNVGAETSSSNTGSTSSSISVSLSSPVVSESGDRARRCSVEHGRVHGKEKPFANANAQTMCSICLGDYEVGDQVRTLPCYHQYHQACIDPWLLQVASLCPICKRDLWPEDV